MVRLRNNPMVSIFLLILAVGAVAFSYYRSVTVRQSGGVDYTKYKRVGGYGRHSQW